jgi:hypothetical protein
MSGRDEDGPDEADKEEHGSMVNRRHASYAVLRPVSRVPYYSLIQYHTIHTRHEVPRIFVVAQRRERKRIVTQSNPRIYL